ncbi:MAG: hypothetical protein WD826_02480 [Actinomycetota bacterium]
MARPDQSIQLTLAGSLAALVLLVAIIGMSTGDTDGAGPTSDLVPAEIGALAEGAIDEVPTPDPAFDDVDPTRSSAATIRAAPKAPGGDTPVVASGGTIKVGITYISDPGGANAAAGFTVGQVDQRRGWEAIIKKINADAPFGRKIVPVWFAPTENEATSKGAERLGQEACAKFTQDERVFMVWVGTVAGGNTLQSCLTKAKVPSIAFGVGESYGKTFATFPYLVEPSVAALDRMAAFYASSLVSNGFFTSFKSNTAPYGPTKPADGKARIGLLRYNQQSHLAAARALKNALAKQGLSLCDGCEFEATYSPTDVADQLNDATEANAAVQGCKTRGCTHILFLGSTAQRLPVFFMDGAERQQYRPRIGLSPLDDPESIKDFLGEPSHAQFRQGQLVTWNPADLGITTKEFTACKKMFTDAGETFEGEEAAGKLAVIATYCDTGTYFAQTMKSVGSVLDLPSWVKGVESMEPIASPGTYRMQTKAGRHDAVGAVQIGSWNDDCTCFKPASKVITV